MKQNQKIDSGFKFVFVLLPFYIVLEFSYFHLDDNWKKSYRRTL